MRIFTVALAGFAETLAGVGAVGASAATARAERP
jgi:hypothetical protein